MEVVEEPIGGVLGNQFGDSAEHLGSIHLSVVGREVDVLAIRIEYVVVVELWDVGDHDLTELWPSD